MCVRAACDPWASSRHPSSSISARCSAGRAELSPSSTMGPGSLGHPPPAAHRMLLVLRGPCRRCCSACSLNVDDQRKPYIANYPCHFPLVWQPVGDALPLGPPPPPVPRLALLGCIPRPLSLWFCGFGCSECGHCAFSQVPTEGDSSPVPMGCGRTHLVAGQDRGKLHYHAVRYAVAVATGHRVWWSR